ncbi:MAG TPA: glycosyltransferase family 39 protein [Dehalococcoidia bacterium]
MAARNSELTAGDRGAGASRQAVAWPAIPWDAIALVGVSSLALLINAWRLSSSGYGNTYYAAAVRSMSLSWSNFFFGSFDPGGFITVDKPPVFLWVGALSVRMFGYSTWALLLPSAVAGAMSVALVWLIVRRYFGTLAATIAAFVLALSPISVEVNRLNLPEPFMILALVGAGACVMRSLDTKWWWVWAALAGALVGVAFNTKMLAAWIPGPAFALAMVAGMRAISWQSARQLGARLAVLAVATFVMSGSWMLVVDAWPASHRPYIGGSTDNTVLDLALGYNGFGRVDGDGQIGGGGGGGTGGGARRVPFTGQNPPVNGNRTVPPPSNFRPGGPAGGPAGGAFRGAGGVFGGLPGWLRMFDDANGGQIGWLLPFAVGGGLVSLWLWRGDPLRRAFVVLSLGWVLTYAGVFSYAQGIFHSYYTSAMAPGIAALCGVSVAAMSQAARRDRRWITAPLILIGASIWVQLAIAERTPDFYGWLRPFMVLTALAGAALAVGFSVRGRAIGGALALSISGLLLLPGAWSLSAAANPSLNTTLPQAGPQQGVAGGTFGSEAFDDGTADLASWLAVHSSTDSTWQLVVSNSQGASRLIAQYGLSVMSLGGFLGNDDTITVGRFAELVAAGDVRYVLVGQSGPGGGNFRGPPTGATLAGANAPAAQRVLSAVQAACKPVSTSDVPASYRGRLYDCAGAADTLRSAATK